jgi:hypothetical protein
MPAAWCCFQVLAAAHRMPHSSQSNKQLRRFL